MNVSLNQTSNAFLPTFQKLELPVTEVIPEWFTIAFASINGGGFCLNVLSLWLLATRRFVYRCKINAFIVSLCLSDLLVALSSFYFLGTITSNNISHFSKRVATIIFSFALETSLMSLCCLSFDRLTAIRKPFRYTEILSKRRVIVIIFLGWLFCLCLLAMQFVFGFIYKHERYVYFNWIVFTSLSLISITFLALVYVYLIYEIHRHSTHIKSHSISAVREDYISDYSSDISKDPINCDHMTDVTFATTSSDQSRFAQQQQRRNIDPLIKHPREHRKSIEKNKSTDLVRAALANTRSSTRSSGERRRLSARGQLIKRERKSVFLCLCIVFVFAASWLPVTVFFVRCLIAHSCEKDDALLFVCSCLVSMNALLDPILYFIIKREFREFLFGKVCRSTSRRNSGDSRRGSSGNFI